MGEDEGRPMTVAMCVKLLALGTLAQRMMRGARWNGADRDCFIVAAGEQARINTAVVEIKRGLRVLEGEDSPEP